MADEKADLIQTGVNIKNAADLSFCIQQQQQQQQQQPRPQQQRQQQIEQRSQKL